MDFALIERLMKMLEASSLNELDVTEGGMRIRLAKQPTGAALMTATTSEQVVETEKPEPASNGALCAGIAGTFYRAAAPGAEPFVRVGDTVSEGDQLAIIEAMKMLNPVEADRAGRIAAIHLDDGGSVEPGTPLFDIEPG